MQALGLDGKKNNKKNKEKGCNQWSGKRGQTGMGIWAPPTDGCPLKHKQ